MPRTRLIAGNWKMNKTPQETETYIRAFLPLLNPGRNVDVLLIPAYPSLDRAGACLQDTEVLLGAQDLFYEASGAFTGAVSAEMVRASGCTYVLAGHSERRHVFGDTDEAVRRKVTAALEGGLRTILCVGETLEERKAEHTSSVLVRQLTSALTGRGLAEMSTLSIAYEPVWAIGTGETATPDQAQDAIAEIREWLRTQFADVVADETLILYGGSVKPANIVDLIAQPDIDGGLVGGASLDPESFARIIEGAAP